MCTKKKTPCLSFITIVDLTLMFIKCPATDQLFIKVMEVNKLNTSQLGFHLIK